MCDSVRNMDIYNYNFRPSEKPENVGKNSEKCFINVRASMYAKLVSCKFVASYKTRGGCPKHRFYVPAIRRRRPRVGSVGCLLNDDALLISVELSNDKEAKGGAD